MTDKELKKLRKGELLELLLDQSRELDRLNAKVKELEEQLNDRRMLMKESGTLAEQAFKLNKVFEAAQAAADQYLENVRHYAETGKAIDAGAGDIVGTENTGDEKAAAVTAEPPENGGADE